MTELVVPSLDFSPLGELGQVYNQARDAASQKRTLAQLGQGGDDADILLKSGNMNLIQLGQQMRNRQNDMMLKQQEIERAQGNSDRDYGLRVRAQNRADEGPGVAVAQRAKVAEQYGLKPGTPEHTQYVLGGTVPQTSSNSITAQVEQRKQAAASLGMNPDHPAYQSFVATGKMPREDAQPLTQTDKKAILEADEMVFANEAAINALREAKKLSPAANSGWFAGARAAVTDPELAGASVGLLDFSESGKGIGHRRSPTSESGLFRSSWTALAYPVIAVYRYYSDSLITKCYNGKKANRARPGRPPTGHELAQVRLDRDTAQAVRAYIERTGLSRSAALRTLIRAGLASQTGRRK